MGRTSRVVRCDPPPRSRQRYGRPLRTPRPADWFGFERFERTLLEACGGSAEDIKRALLQSVKRFTRNRPPEDDQTLVVVSFESVTDAEIPKPFSLLAGGYSEQVH